MALIDRIAARMGYEKRAASDPSWNALYAATGPGAAVNARKAENLSTVLACTCAISSAAAYVPAYVYRREGNSRIEAPDHPLMRLVRRGANDHQSWPDFVEAFMASALLTGNGLAAIERDGKGDVIALRFIPWAWADVSQLASGRLAYDISEQPGNMGRIGRRYRLLQGEVLHLRDRSDDGLIGRSRLSRAAEVVTAALSLNEFAGSFIGNGAQPSGVISHPGTMKDDQRAAIRESFDRRHAGAGNAGRALILDGGLTWQPSQISPEDAELLESRKFSVEEICRLFQVPPPLVQDYSHNTFTNSETAGRWFAQFTLAPWARKIEAEFARSIFSEASGYELELDLSGFLRGDPQTRWAAHKIALDANVLDPDEVREIEGFNPRGRTGEVLG